MTNSESPIVPAAHQNLDGSTDPCYHLGLTKREYFAGLAMQGHLAGIRTGVNHTKIAMLSIELADELLTELEK